MQEEKTDVSEYEKKLSGIITADQVRNLHKAGFFIAPIEPTIEMKVASVDVLKTYDHVSYSWDVSGWNAAWPAMIKARPKLFGVG